MASNEQIGDLSALSEAVRARRSERGWTQADVLERADGQLSKASLYRVEAGRDPESAVSRAVLRALDTGLEWADGVSRSIYLRGRTADLTYTDRAGQTVEVEAKSPPADVVAAIKADPSLLPEAKQHLVNQYGLLLRVAAASGSSAATDRPATTEGPGLRAVARKGTPRAKREPHDDGGST